MRCNEKKLSARLCSESCALLFLAQMVDLCGPIRQPALVMGVLDKSFDVFIPEMGISRRVYIDVSRPMFGFGMWAGLWGAGESESGLWVGGCCFNEEMLLKMAGDFYC